jgi:hypothetical protein
LKTSNTQPLWALFLKIKMSTGVSFASISLGHQRVTQDLSFLIKWFIVSKHLEDVRF